MITEAMVAAAEAELEFEAEAKMEVEAEELTKKEIREKILKEIRMSQHDLQIYQDCPNTFITVKFIYRGVTLETFGFAKANWPDPWDAEYGINMAIEKAFYKAARVLSKIPVKEVSSPIVEYGACG